MPLADSPASAEPQEALRPEDFHLLKDANQMKQNTSWQCQTSGEITSSAQDTAMSTIVLAGVDGENNANTAKRQYFLSSCIAGTVAFSAPLLFLIVVCCVRAYPALEAEKSVSCCSPAPSPPLPLPNSLPYLCQHYYVAAASQEAVVVSVL